MLEGWEAIGPIEFGFLVLCSKFDWQQGIMECEFIDDDTLGLDWMFGLQDFVASEFPNAEYKVFFSGLKFEASSIELLLPSAQLTANVQKRSATSIARYVGRPRKWDWDGAMGHIIAQAQTPDGLPTGHGAQAKVEAMIATWFESQTGSSPAVSQIRSRASRIMQMIEKD